MKTKGQDGFVNTLSLPPGEHSINSNCPYNHYFQFWKSENDIKSVSVCLEFVYSTWILALNALLKLNGQNSPSALVGALSGWTRRARHPANRPSHDTHLACACSWGGQLAETLCKHVPGPERFPSGHPSSTLITSIIVQAWCWALENTRTAINRVFPCREFTKL